jgi:uncharacterized repeat protein (TIGR03803 family)
MPNGGLVLSGGTLFGTAQNGGTNGSGTVFKVNTDGTDFATLLNFPAAQYNANFNLTNNGGATPNGGLVLSDATLYGTTSGGGLAGNGTVFAVNTDGTAFTTVHDFSPNTGSGSTVTNLDGANPYAGLALSGGNLYGTAHNGGVAGAGTVFAIALGSGPTPVPLTLQLVNGQVILSWTNATFSLQAAPSVTGPYTTVAEAVSPYTNTISGQQQFFRLINN